LFCKENNADYYEELEDYSIGVWIKDVLSNDDKKIALCLNDDGSIDFGSVFKSDDLNFGVDGSDWKIEDIPWIIETLNVLKEFRK